MPATRRKMDRRESVIRPLTRIERSRGQADSLQEQFLLSWIMPADGILAARSPAATSARPASRSNFRPRVSEPSHQYKFARKSTACRRGFLVTRSLGSEVLPFHLEKIDPQRTARTSRSFLRRGRQEGAYPTCTASIEIDPPSTPSIGKRTLSRCCFVASTYSSGR